MKKYIALFFALLLFAGVAVSPATTSASLVGMAYNNVSFSVGLQDISPTSLAMSSDGTKAYVVGVSNDRVHQYSLPTPGSLIGASYDNVSLLVSGQDVNPTGLAFSSDGTKMFVVGTLNDTVSQYSLPTPWSLTGAVFDNVSFSVRAEDGTPDDLAFSSDGTKMFIVGTVNDRVFQYFLPTPWSLTGASYDNVSFSVAGQDTAPSGLAFDSDGTKMYVIGGVSDTVFQYSLPTPWSLTGTVLDSISLSIVAQEVSPTGLAFGSGGTKMFIVGTFSDSVFQYSVPPPAPVLTSVTVAPPTASIETGATVQLSASPLDQNAAFIGVTVTWTSSDDLVATVDATGLVTGVAAGSATVTASATDGVITVTGTSAITVTAPAPILTSVDVAPPTASIETGATAQLTASPLDQNNAAFTLATVTWSSSDTAIATVDATGLVTGVAPGTATITSSATDGVITVTGTSAITVTAVVPPPPPPADPVLTSVTVAPPTASIETGATAQLTASPLDQNNAAFTLATVTWTSSDALVATVDATGLVTGVAAGLATITASATDGVITVTGTSVITVTAPAPVCETGADTDGNGSIGILEILNYVRDWKAGSVSNLLILRAVVFWKAGVGC